MAHRLTIAFAFFGAFIIAGTLSLWGQPWICTCGEIKLWVGSIFDGGNSQHIADWYTLSHILHGVLIAIIGRWMFPRLSFAALFFIACLTGIAWEVVEHTEWVLGAFRATTVNQGYTGDSVLNAVADYMWMIGGFLAAYAMRTWNVVGLIAALELSAVFVARDSLVLTTLMLVYPIETVDTWQQELNPNAVRG